MSHSGWLRQSVCFLGRQPATSLPHAHTPQIKSDCRRRPDVVCTALDFHLQWRVSRHQRGQWLKRPSEAGCNIALVEVEERVDYILIDVYRGVGIVDNGIGPRLHAVLLVGDGGQEPANRILRHAGPAAFSTAGFTLDQATTRSFDPGASIQRRQWWLILSILVQSHFSALW